MRNRKPAGVLLSTKHVRELIEDGTLRSALRKDPRFDAADIHYIVATVLDAIEVERGLPRTNP